MTHSNILRHPCGKTISTESIEILEGQLQLSPEHVRSRNQEWLSAQGYLGEVQEALKEESIIHSL